ncbi:MAG: TetR family transcriptional regulator C-terminal domain-containing protein [Pikeienuella sp.]
MAEKTTPRRGRPRGKDAQNADRRKRQLLDAAYRSVVKHGLAKTTLATVTAEADLSQGVAVFYYKTKNALLTALLVDLYESYEANWVAALATAGDAPLDRLNALVEADFHPSVCNPNTLAVWFAFWGEQRATPQYAEVTAKFDANRAAMVQGVCRVLFPPEQVDGADELADWLETLTDGYYQRVHLFPDTFHAEHAIAGAMAFLERMLPQAD